MRELNRLITNITDGTRAAHAFIVEGRAGEGRSAFVTSLAMGLECTSPEPDSRPCGQCPSCRQVAAGTSLDVVRMNKSTGQSKNARATYKVNDASEFIERLGMGAYGRYLIGIIDDADTMSEVIQNKLLKTLEEPGRNTILLLAAANRDNLLSTVRSRCSEIRLADYSEDVNDLAPEDPGVSEARIKTFTEIASMFEDRKCRFHEFRAAVDKHIKSREEAYLLLDLLEDELRQMLMDPANSGSPEMLQKAAGHIEAASVARMDIRRELSYNKALKRLYLEIRQN